MRLDSGPHSSCETLTSPLVRKLESIKEQKELDTEQYKLESGKIFELEDNDKPKPEIRRLQPNLENQALSYAKSFKGFQTHHSNLKLSQDKDMQRLPLGLLHSLRAKARSEQKIHPLMPEPVAKHGSTLLPVRSLADRAKDFPVRNFDLSARGNQGKTDLKSQPQ